VGWGAFEGLIALLTATVATGSPASAINAQSVDPASVPSAAGADDGGLGVEETGLGGSGGGPGCDGIGGPAGVIWELQDKDIACTHTINPNTTKTRPISLTSFGHDSQSRKWRLSRRLLQFRRHADDTSEEKC